MFYGGYYPNGGLIRKQLTAAGWKGTLVGGDGMKDPGLSKAAGNAAAEGTVVTCPCSPPEQAGGTFVADYKAKWNVAAGTYSDVAFDAANIFLQGIDAGNTTHGEDEHVPVDGQLQGRREHVQVHRRAASWTRS